MRNCFGASPVYVPDLLDGFDRLVAFDAETTGRRTADAEFIRKRPFAWRAPGIIMEVRFVEMPRRRGLAQGRAVGLEGQPEGPIDPEAIRIHGIRPADLKSAARFSTSLLRVKDFVGGSPIVAHAYKNARDFLYCEFARATVIPWGESAYDEQRYICTRILFAQLFPGAVKSLTSMCDRPVPDTRERVIATCIPGAIEVLKRTVQHECDGFDLAMRMPRESIPGHEILTHKQKWIA